MEHWRKMYVVALFLARPLLSSMDRTRHQDEHRNYIHKQPLNWAVNDTRRCVLVPVVRTSLSISSVRFGESFYSFLPRCVGGSFVSAWRLEIDRLRDRNLPFYNNEMLW